MALSLGKLTLIVGAGLVGSVLAKEGRTSNVSDFFSGAFKIVLKQLKQDDSTSSNSKPRNDSLLQQVNSLRQELQLLASNRSVTIVTSSNSGSGKYGAIIVVVVVGYGYIWWKGWKISDMMFATRRGLNDACSSVAKQLENVYSSISATKQHLSSRIDRVDSKIDECAENTAATKEEVSELRGDVKLIGADVLSVHQVVQSLETKINRIEGRQSETNFGVGKLIAFVRGLENSKSMEQIEGAASGSSRPALQLPPVSPSRAVSLPVNSSAEPPSPSTSNGSHKYPLQSTVSASGLKELYGISDGVGVSSLSIRSNGVHASENTNNDNSISGLFGGNFSGRNLPFFTRSRSAMQYFKSSGQSHVGASFHSRKGNESTVRKSYGLSYENHLEPGDPSKEPLSMVEVMAVLVMLNLERWREETVNTTTGGGGCFAIRLAPPLVMWWFLRRECWVGFWRWGWWLLCHRSPANG
ncbi:Protein of unknown function (DUF1664) [Abeliophyllum distichum]|uniref:DUF1664 domain-containing protein n=1 Tax=Abeliophyllum distichum TaxID=126358 RepID=A0ABD1U402_9LAMI